VAARDRRSACQARRRQILVCSTSAACAEPCIPLPETPEGAILTPRIERLLKATGVEVKPYRGPPITLGSAAAAEFRLVIWCKACGHRSEPDPAEQARWDGPETPVLEWRARLVCSRCGSRNIDMVVTGAGRR
jgi:hypothetical protein